MTEYHKFTMNTSLKNAMIFADDSWDSDMVQIKTEPVDENSQSFMMTPIKCNNIIRQEEESNTPFKLAFKSIKIKDEQLSPKIKVEPPSPPRNLDFSNCFKEKSKFKESNSPPIKREIITRTREKLRSYKKDNDLSNISKGGGKSTKLRQRDSPYKRIELARNQKDEPRRSAVKRDLSNSSKGETIKRKRRQVEMESDVTILQRRQKQIDFGKNTIGYDNYIRLVARNKRSSDDPQTPNKNLKYSRRAWDGLIKQWRLRLHKYDP